MGVRVFERNRPRRGAFPLVGKSGAAGAPTATTAYCSGLQYIIRTRGIFRNKPQQSATIRNNPQQTATNRNNPQQTATSRNNPQHFGALRNEAQVSGTLENFPDYFDKCAMRKEEGRSPRMFLCVPNKEPNPGGPPMSIGSFEYNIAHRS